MKLSDMNDFIWHFKNTYLQLFCQSNIKKWANTESPMTVKWDWSDLCILRCDFARGGGLRALWNRKYPRNITDFMLYKSVRFLVVNRDLLEALHQVQLWLLNSFFVKEQWELEEKLNGLIYLYRFYTENFFSLKWIFYSFLFLVWIWSFPHVTSLRALWSFLSHEAASSDITLSFVNSYVIEISMLGY